MGSDFRFKNTNKYGDVLQGDHIQFQAVQFHNKNLNTNSYSHIHGLFIGVIVKFGVLVNKVFFPFFFQKEKLICFRVSSGVFESRRVYDNRGFF